MAIRRGSKNNILAGAFLIISLALALGVFFVLANLWERLTVKHSSYQVSFTLDEGADGLDKGAIVKVGGVKAGQVVGWKYAKDEKDQRIVGVIVQIEVKSEIVLYDNAVALLVLPLLGSTSSINFPDVGDPATVAHAHGDARLEPDEVLVGHLASPSFLKQAGYGPEQAKSLQRIIKNAEETSERINRITSAVDGDLDPALGQVRSMLADASTIAADAKASWKEWQQRVSSALEKVDEASRKLAAIMDDAKAGVQETRDVIATAHEVLDENRPKVSAVMDNIKELSEKLNRDTYAALMQVMEGADRGVQEFATTVERVRLLVGRNAAELETTIANARLASDQLKLTMIEVRQAPWKILAKPEGRKDLENEVLYDSVRAYAAAVADLRAAADSLDSLTQGSRGSEVDKASISEKKKVLDEAFLKYQEKEREFLNRWVGK